MLRITRGEAQAQFESGIVVSHELDSGWQNYKAACGIGDGDGNIAWQSPKHPSCRGCNEQTEIHELPDGYQLPLGDYYVA